MSTAIIDPDYNWKQAASQEGVDYGAVQKSFMDQSYAVVANKAKILFQDPFRLGFEIVHRNEKATKMVGIYAFRVNSDLLYAPVFFVNGEIKAADMLYRADVKRFVPLTEEWCSYLVRGIHENSGEVVDRNRVRQSDAYMDRLAYPQRVKYASQEDFAMTKQAMPDAWAEEMSAARDTFVKAARDGSLWEELMLHSADNTPLRKLLPMVINEAGPEALEKLAAFIGNSPVVAKAVASNYTKEELETVSGWMAKEASSTVEPAISIVCAPELAKSAAQRERIFDKGYDLVDHRLDESVNTVIEEVGDGTIKELSTPGKVQILMANGELEEALLLRLNERLLGDEHAPPMCVGESETLGKPEYAFFPSDKQLFKLPYGEDVFGDEMVDQDTKAKSVPADSLSVGKCYVALDTRDLSISRAFYVEDIDKDGECLVISISITWGGKTKLFYAPGRGDTSGRYLSDDTFFLEVDCDAEANDHGGRTIELNCTKFPMSSRGVEQWFRTAGGITTSQEVTVRPKAGPTFDIEHREDGTLLKVARDLGWLEAHLKLAEDFSLRVDKAGEILDKAVDGDVTYRVFDSVTKCAYLTRPEGMEQWIQSYDPELGVQMDAPQQQILSTHTPRRPDQQQRYGDVYQGPRSQNSDTAESLLPMEAILHNSPDELAQMSQAYGLPHILDHGCVGQMASTSHSIVEQIKRYIPDMESGVDRYFRVLFLLRYRPGDFEEVYGKDDLIEFEQDLAELGAKAGENLLKMLQRFEPNQYASQEN